jgi:hypothetical protein
MAPCPWAGFTPANLRFCERPLCGFVTEPANTWTNVGFLAVGLVVIALARRDHAPRAGLLGPIALATAVASSALHATSTFVGQALDQGVMLFESALFVVLNLDRLSRRPPRQLGLIYASIVAPSVALLLAFPESGIALFVTHVVVFLALELRLAFRDFAKTRYRALAGVGATFVASYALWWLDRLGVVCDPDNHVFTAHGAWHLLGAASFYFWYRHYAQFEV